MNKRFLLFLLTFTLSVTGVRAQINQADKLYESFSYSLAIPYYLKVAEKIGDPDRNYAIPKLADCYRLVNDQLHAKIWYAQTVALPACESINWFYYGEALRCAQEYDMAQKAFETYNSLNPADPRGTLYATFCKEVPKLRTIPAGFEIKHIPGLNSEWSDFSPVYYGDGIVFVSDRRQNLVEDKRYTRTEADYLDLFIAIPGYLDEFSPEMDAPKPFDGNFNQSYHDGPASFARHDSLIYFTRTEKGKTKKDANNFRNNRLQVFWSAKDSKWSGSKPFFMNSDNYSVGHPALTADGNTIYFVSDMPGGMGGTDIYSCKWQNRQWGQPKNLGTSVNTVGNEMFPVILGDQLYFASNGFAGFGGLDLFKSEMTDGKWSIPVNLGSPVNSSYDDFALVLDARGKKGYFSSNRPGGLGNDDIYSCKVIENQPTKTLAAELLPNTPVSLLTGFIKEKQTQKPLQAGTVFVLNTETGKVKILKTDAKGQFKTPVNKGVLYVVKGMENNYLSDCITLKSEISDTAHTIKLPGILVLDQLELNKVFSANAEGSVFETIYYGNNEWNIQPEAEKELNKLIQLMKENPVTIELGSHTDCRGSRESNLELSQKRAEAAVRYIILQGIDPTRITALGYGESKPQNRCSDGVPCSPTELQANRRTEFKVTGFTKSDAHPGYDLSKFKGDEEIPVYMLDRDFFINCLQDKQKAKTEVNSETKIQNPTATRTTPKSASPKPEINSAKEEKMSAEANQDVIEYRVQLLATSTEKSLLDTDFESLDDVRMYTEGGLFKYTSGIFGTYAEASSYCKKIAKMRYPGAFVIPFSNGKRVYSSHSN